MCGDQVKRPQLEVAWVPFVFPLLAQDGAPLSLEQMEGTACRMYSAQWSCPQTSPEGRPPLRGDLKVEAHESISFVFTELFFVRGFVQSQFCHVLNSNAFYHMMVAALSLF